MKRWSWVLLTCLVAGCAVEYDVHVPTIRHELTVPRARPVHSPFAERSRSGADREPLTAARRVVKPISAFGAEWGYADELWILPFQASVSEPAGTRVDAVSSAGRIAVERVNSHLSAQIVGPFARMELAETYRNPSTVPVALRCRLPLPANGVVSDFVIHVGERRIRGVVRPRAEADAIYAAARADGLQAHLVTATHSGVLEQRITRVGPQRTVKISLAVLSVLPYERGRWIFATALTRREGPASIPTTLRVEVESGGPLLGVHSPTHNILTVRKSPSLIRVALAATPSPSNRAFRLEIEPDRSGHGAHLWTSGRADGGAFAGVLLPPPLAKLPPSLPREMIVLCHRGKENRNGGGRNDWQVLGPVFAANRRKGDGLRYVGTGGAVSSISSVEPLNDSTLLSTVSAMLESPHRADQRRVFFLLTDGELDVALPWQRVLGSLSDHDRLFVISAGSESSRALLRRLARGGRGAELWGIRWSDLRQPLDGLLKETLHPVLQGVRLSGDPGAKSLPVVLPDVYPQRPLVFYGHGRSSGTYALEGWRAGKPVTIPLSRHPVGSVDLSRWVEVLMAQAQLRALLEAAAINETPAHQAQIRSMAVEAQLLSPYTGFLTVDVLGGKE
ncbi:MAG: VIT domain-containing protein [Planctomycetota bacterium]|jgi:Ca-activated chloride channel family protein